MGSSLKERSLTAIGARNIEAGSFFLNPIYNAPCEAIDVMTSERGKHRMAKPTLAMNKQFTGWNLELGCTSNVVMVWFMPI